MEDAGNFTCVASNDVLTRFSPTAVIKIYGKNSHTFISFSTTLLNVFPLLGRGKLLCYHFQAQRPNYSLTCEETIIIFPSSKCGLSWHEAMPAATFQFHFEWRFQCLIFVSTFLDFMRSEKFTLFLPPLLLLKITKTAQTLSLSSSLHKSRLSS